MTPLDSSHLEVFLEIFHFLNSNLNFEFGPVWYRPKPEPGRTGVRPGQTEPVPTGLVNPDQTLSARGLDERDAWLCLVSSLEFLKGTLTANYKN